MPARHRPGPRAGLVAVLVFGLAASCSGGDQDPLSSPEDKPKNIKAEPEQVDACTLVTPADVDQFLDLVVQPVTLEYGAAQVPTLTCGLGTEFGVADVRVGLATGPIALSVFEDAYGPKAGGNPEPVRRLGELAFLRNEEEQLEIRALVNGAILTVEVASATTEPVERSSVVELARIAADRLPDNPRLAPTVGGPHCAKPGVEPLTAAIGSAPSVVSALTGPNGEVMCSWASRPGSVVVTIIREPDRVAAYRRLLDNGQYVEVPDSGLPSAFEVWSRSDRAGDQLVFGSDGLAVINVVPTAGFSDPSLATTPGELVLADAVATTMLQGSP